MRYGPGLQNLNSTRGITMTTESDMNAVRHDLCAPQGQLLPPENFGILRISGSLYHSLQEPGGIPDLCRCFPPPFQPLEAAAGHTSTTEADGLLIDAFISAIIRSASPMPVRGSACSLSAFSWLWSASA